VIFVVTHDDLSVLRGNSSEYMKGTCRKVTSAQIDKYFEMLREEIHPFMPVTTSVECWEFVEDKMMEPVEFEDGVCVQPDDVLFIPFFDESDRVVGGILSAFESYTN
jgi:hypothetical protein